MKDPPVKVPDVPAEIEIAIRKGHVRRASLAADAVYSAAQGADGVENGVVLMSAILLIERLATAHQCDPRSVVNKIVRCFDIRDGYLRATKDKN